MNQLIFDLQINTPIFLKADDPSSDGLPVLRAAPFRGEIRYWLRALASAVNVADLNQIEDNIFGSTKAGSEISLWVKGNLRTSRVFMLPHTEALNALSFSENQKFQLGFRGRPQREITDKALTALLFWLNFGGVGKRARRGFGSLQCVHSDSNNALIPRDMSEYFWQDIPKNGKDLTDCVEKLIKNLPTTVTCNRILPQASYFQLASYPSFQNKSWAIVVGSAFFPDYKSAMQDFWNNHLRQPANIHPTAYGFVRGKDRLASPIHVHIAKTMRGFHILLTAFFAKPNNTREVEKIRNLLEDCCKSYKGTVFY